MAKDPYKLLSDASHSATPSRKLVVEEIDIQDLHNSSVLEAALWSVNEQCFPKVSREKFDLKTYPRGKIFIQRDLSLTPGDPKDPKNIVAYNFVGFAYVQNHDGKKALVLKIGPSAVLAGYRGYRFVPYSSLQHVLKEYLKCLLGSQLLYALVAAGNPWIRAICQQLQATTSSQKSKDAFDDFIKAAAAAIYPPHVPSQEFAQGAVLESNWTPSNIDKINSYSTVHMVPVSLFNLVYAFYLSVFGTKKAKPVMVEPPVHVESSESSESSKTTATAADAPLVSRLKHIST